MLPGLLLRYVHGSVRELMATKNKNKLVLASAAIVIAGAGGTFMACSSGDTSGGDAGDATTQDVVGNNDAANDAGGNDTGPTSDACVPADGGLACDPAHVTCGTKACDAGTQFCCISDAGTKFTCDNLSADGGIPTNVCAGSTKDTCDEAANCPAGQICCGFVGPGGGFSTACQTSCGTGLQFCRSSTECKAGVCTVQLCRGVTIETCGSLCP